MKQVIEHAPREGFVTIIRHTLHKPGDSISLSAKQVNVNRLTDVNIINYPLTQGLEC